MLERTTQVLITVTMHTARDSCQKYISSTALYTHWLNQLCVPHWIYIPPFIIPHFLYSTPQRILHIGCMCLRIRYVYTSALGVIPPIWVYTSTLRGQGRVRVGPYSACTSLEMIKLYRAFGAEPQLPLTWCGMLYCTHRDSNG